MERLNLALVQAQLFFLAPLAQLKKRDERGGSLSIETLLIILGVIVIVALVIAGVKSYVTSHLPH